MKKLKRGQMKLSFGMIFSIILIIIFIAFAFYFIYKFLDLGDKVSVGKFIGELQADVDRIWRGSQASQEVNYNLPTDIEYVCFINFERSNYGSYANFYSDLKKVIYGGENLAFYPVGSGKGLDSSTIKHLDLLNITRMNNPYCLKQENGKVKLTLQKSFSENNVNLF